MNSLRLQAAPAAGNVLFLNKIDLDSLAVRTGVPVYQLVKVFSDRSVIQIFLEDLLDKEKLALRLDLSVSFINKLMSTEGLPFFKLGKAVRFKTSEISSWLSERRRP